MDMTTEDAGLPDPVEPLDNSAALAEVRAVIERGPFDDTWDSLRGYRPPRWYRDAKFGIFIHWGVYSVPAFENEWYSRNMYLEGTAAYEHHVQTYGAHTEFGYKDFIPEFRMQAFEPARWAALFRAAGAQFVVPVAEHHDGFAMYDTARSRWSAARMGPHRDVFGDLLEAVDAAWMVRGASSHRAEHWFFMNGGARFESDVLEPAYRDFYGPAQREETAPSERFLEDWLLRTVEIIDRYRPQILWFDWWIEQPAFEPYLRRLAAYYYNRAAEWGRDVVINYKWGAFAAGSAVYDIERGAMSGSQPEVWQNDTAVSRSSWCWIEEGHDHKTSTEIIAELADVVSKNGNLLLNIGPRPDGTIPAEEERLLREIGAWLSINGEAVYGTRPWIIPGEGPTHVVEGSMIDSTAPAYVSEDIRFTTRTDVTGDYVYAILLAEPEGGVIRIRAFGEASGLLGRDIQQVSVLGAPAPVTTQRTAEGLIVHLGERRGDGLVVVKLFLAAEATPPRTDFLHG